MLRTLIFGTIAAVAGRKLYKSGALHRVGDNARRRFSDSGLTRDRSSAYAGTGTTGGTI